MVCDNGAECQQETEAAARNNNLFVLLFDLEWNAVN